MIRTVRLIVLAALLTVELRARWHGVVRAWSVHMVVTAGSGAIVPRGRDGECAQLDELLEGALNGRSGVLVLIGDAGVGKTALLQYAIASGSALRVVRAAGIEAELELAFAGLHQLCAPMLGRLERLGNRVAASVLRATLIWALVELAARPPRRMPRLRRGRTTASANLRAVLRSGAGRP